jgi:hypothetical protein
MKNLFQALFRRFKPRQPDPMFRFYLSEFNAMRGGREAR